MFVKVINFNHKVFVKLLDSFMDKNVESLQTLCLDNELRRFLLTIKTKEINALYSVKSDVFWVSSDDVEAKSISKNDAFIIFDTGNLNASLISFQ